MSSLEVVPQHSSDKDDGSGKNGASHSPKQIHVTNDNSQNHVRFSLRLKFTFMSMFKQTISFVYKHSDNTIVGFCFALIYI